MRPGENGNQSFFDKKQKQNKFYKGGTTHKKIHYVLRSRKKISPLKKSTINSKIYSNTWKVPWFTFKVKTTHNNKTPSDKNQKKANQWKSFLKVYRVDCNVIWSGVQKIQDLPQFDSIQDKKGLSSTNIPLKSLSRPDPKFVLEEHMEKVTKPPLFEERNSQKQKQKKFRPREDPPKIINLLKTWCYQERSWSSSATEEEGDNLLTL